MNPDKTPSRMLPLALAVLATFALAACDRDDDADDMYEADAATAPAVADPMPPEPMMPEPVEPVDSGMTFAEMDANADGSLSRDELTAGEMLHEHFDVADTDGDGMLSQDEVDAHRAEMEMTAPADPVPPATE